MESEVPTSRRNPYPALAVAAACAFSAVALASVRAPLGPLAAALISQGVWIGLAWAATSLERLPQREALGLAQSPWTTARLGGWVLGFCTLSALLSLAIHHAEAGAGGSLEAIESLLGTVSAWWILPAVVSLGVAPGVGEELLFRGWLQRLVGRRFSPTLGIACASVAFAVAHFDWVHGAAALILGLYLGLLAQRSGSTRSAITAHVANNVLAVLWGTLHGGALWVGLAVWLVGTLQMLRWTGNESSQALVNPPA